MTRPRVFSHGVIGAALATLGVLAVTAGMASAAVVHQQVGSFNGEGSPGGQFGGLLAGDAADVSGGYVYVAESEDVFTGGAFRVDRFTTAGAYAGVELTGAGTPHGAFAFHASFEVFNSVLAVDNTTSGANRTDLYVADTEHHVLDRFSQSGVFLCQIAGSETEVETPGAKECAGAKGSGLSEAVTPASVAVDASGDVFVTDVAHEAIDEFGPGGEFLSQIKDAHLSSEMPMIAVAPAGAIYVISSNALVKFEGGHFASVFDSNPTRAVAVDSTTGHLYVSDLSALETELVEYESSGALLDVTLLEDFHGLTVGSAGKLYGTESGVFGPSRVAVVSGDITVPSVTAAPPTSVSETAATLNGQVDPDNSHGGGEVTACQFEYGTTTSYGAVVPCEPSPPYGELTAASAHVSLSRATTYHFRIEAQNSNGIPSHSQDATLTTAGPPSVDGAWALVNGTQAQLRAKINPLGIDTTCELQYVDDAHFKHGGYGAAVTQPCSPEDLGAGFGDQTARVTVNGLQVATNYHYRFLATNTAGLTGVADQTFTTFGANSYRFEVLDREGKPFTQAAGHPYEMVTSFGINHFLRAPDEPGPEKSTEGVDGNPRDVLTQLPAGLIGDPSATPKCTAALVLARSCPGADQVGVIEVNLESETTSERLPIYNVVPPKGVAAEFASTPLGKANLFIDARLRSGGDYGVTAESSSVTALAGVHSVLVKLWGVPADASHDPERKCNLSQCNLEGGERVLKPFLRMPTSCVGPLATSLSVDSWQNPGVFAETTSELPATTGCEHVPFTPSLLVQPTSAVADSPTGLHVDLHLPQNVEPEGTGEADLRNTTVTLPAGLTTNPGAATGLAACSPAQIGLTSAPGITPVTFTPNPVTCPDAAKVGTVEVDTPLLDHPLPGSLYIATPHANPFGSLLAIYIVVEDPQSGVVVKLAGDVKLNPTTGQITTTFTDSPQVPFEDFKLDFFEGPRAALATPESCGTFAATSVLSSWSGGAPVEASEPFAVSSGCVSGFTPAFTAGTATPQAGAFSPFTLSFSRTDSEQGLAGVTVTLPPGLIGKIAGVPRCTDAQLAAAAANTGAAEQAASSCPAASQIGTVTTFCGPGPSPVAVTGKAYLTGPYKGAPFGIAVVVPAVAGPFDLGTVVIREALQIDPSTAQVTAVSDPFPTILQGIPLRLKRVDVTLDRPGFTLNPTSCDPESIGATLTSIGGATAAVASRFQVGGCQSLPFKPTLTASTGAPTSKQYGANLTVRVSQQPGEANIHRVHLQLPVALPSRLSTLQKACTEAQFNSNPAGCPEGAFIGSATARTPILDVPLTGPAILVSRGGAAFPDVEFLLQGEGVHITLDGKTDIKKGITYSTFETVPDAPISSFEAVLPTGPHSILTFYGGTKAGPNLCAYTKTLTTKKKVTVRVHGHIRHLTRTVKRTVPIPLSMPTSITAQNGALITKTTPIAVTGCQAHKASNAGSKHGHKAGRAQRRRG